MSLRESWLAGANMASSASAETRSRPPTRKPSILPSLNQRRTVPSETPSVAAASRGVQVGGGLDPEVTTTVRIAEARGIHVSPLADLHGFRRRLFDSHHVRTDVVAEGSGSGPAPKRNRQMLGVESKLEVDNVNGATWTTVVKR